MTEFLANYLDASTDKKEFSSGSAPWAIITHIWQHFIVSRQSANITATITGGFALKFLTNVIYRGNAVHESLSQKMQFFIWQFLLGLY
jgi:hypothetical protein